MKFFNRSFLASLIIIMICNVHYIENTHNTNLEKARKLIVRRALVKKADLRNENSVSKFEKSTKVQKFSRKIQNKSTKVAKKKKFIFTTLLIVGIIIAAVVLLTSVATAIYKHVYLYRKQRENLDLINETLRKEYVLKIDLCSFGRLNSAKIKKELTIQRFNLDLVSNSDMSCATVAPPAKKTECEKELAIITKLKTVGENFKTPDYISQLEAQTDEYCNYAVNEDLGAIATRTRDNVNNQESVSATVFKQLGLVLGLVSNVLSLVTGAGIDEIVEKVVAVVDKATTAQDILSKINAQIMKATAVTQVSEGEDNQSSILDKFVLVIKWVSNIVEFLNIINAGIATSTTSIVGILANLLDLITKIVAWQKVKNPDSIEKGLFICSLVAPILSITSNICSLTGIPGRVKAMINLIIKLIIVIKEVVEMYYETKVVFRDRAKMTEVFEDIKKKITLEKCEQEVKVFKYQEFLLGSNDQQANTDKVAIDTIRGNLGHICKDSLRTCMEIDSYKDIDDKMIAEGDGKTEEFFEDSFFKMLARNILDNGPITDIAPSLNFFNDESLINLGYKVVHRGNTEATYLQMNSVLYCRNCRVNTYISYACLQYVNPSGGILNIFDTSSGACPENFPPVYSNHKKKVLRVNIFASLVYFKTEVPSRVSGQIKNAVTDFKFVLKSKQKLKDEGFNSLVSKEKVDEVVVPEVDVTFKTMTYTKINGIAVFDHESADNTTIEAYKKRFEVETTNNTTAKREAKLLEDFCENNCYNQYPLTADGQCFKTFANSKVPRISQVIEYEQKCAECPQDSKHMEHRYKLMGGEMLTETIAKITRDTNLQSRNGKYAFGFHYNSKYIFDKDEKYYVWKDEIRKDLKLEKGNHDYFTFFVACWDVGATFIRSNMKPGRKVLYEDTEHKTRRFKKYLETKKWDLTFRTHSWSWKSEDYVETAEEKKYPKSYDQVVVLENNGLLESFTMNNIKNQFNYPTKSKLSLKRCIEGGEFIEGDHFSLTSYNDEYIFKFDDDGRRRLIAQNKISSFCKQENINADLLVGSRLVMTKAGSLIIYTYRSKELCRFDTPFPGARIILKNSGDLSIYSADNFEIKVIGKAKKIK